MARTLGRRRFMQTGSAAAAAAVLAARGGSALAAPRAQATPAASPTANLGVEGRVRYSVVPSGPDDIGLIQEIFDTTFRERYPNLEVTAEPAPSGQGDPLLAQMVANEAPDILDTWTSRATPYIDAGQILDLKPLVDRDFTADSLADFFPWVLAAQTLPNGLQWGMPRYINLTVLIYNRDMVEATGVPDPSAGEGWSLDAYRDAILKLTQKEGDRTRVYGAHIPVFNYGRFANKVEAWGGTVVDPNDNTRATFDSAEGQAAAEWHRQLMLDEGAIADKQFLDTGGGENVTGSRANFAAGRIATMEEGFYPFSLADAVGDSFRFGIAAPPAGPAGRPILGSADGFSIWSGSPNQEAAWEAVKFMTGLDYQRALARATGLIPVRRSLIEEYRQIVTELRPNLAEAGVEVGLRLLETGDPHERPLFAKGGTDFSADAEAEDIINSGLEQIFVVGDTPVTFLTELAAQVTAVMQGT